MNTQTKMKILWIALALSCIIFLTVCGGCTDSVPDEITDEDIIVIPAGATPTSTTGKQVYGNLVIDVPDFVQHWKPDGTCYWEGRIQVTNTGNEPEMNVVIRSHLIRTSDDQKEYTNSKSLSRINPNEPLSYVSQLYGNCNEDYYIIVAADTE